jgi:hypothetical protein
MFTSGDRGTGHAFHDRTEATRLDDGLALASALVSPMAIPAGGSMAAIVADMAPLSPDDHPRVADDVKGAPGTDVGAPETNLTPFVEMLPRRDAVDSAFRGSPRSRAVRESWRPRYN